MMEKMLLQTFYRGLNTSHQSYFKLVGGYIMNKTYQEANEILDEMLETSSAWQSRDNIPYGDPSMSN